MHRFPPSRYLSAPADNFCRYGVCCNNLNAPLSLLVAMSYLSGFLFIAAF